MYEDLAISFRWGLNKLFMMFQCPAKSDKKKGKRGYISANYAKR